ncbi:MAG TPA: hypothetical protein VFU15_00970 [Bacteroidia bacterium]|nr:hypothetical protein [Bacteroidia bacterium]
MGRHCHVPFPHLDREKTETYFLNYKFSPAIKERKSVISGEEELHRKLLDNIKNRHAHRRYRGYFDMRLLFLRPGFIPPETGNASPSVPIGTQEMSLIARYDGIHQDIHELNGIVRTQNEGNVIFEFDGKTCWSRDVERVKKLLMEEDKELFEKLSEADAQLYSWHYSTGNAEEKKVLLQLAPFYSHCEKLRQLTAGQAQAFNYYANLMTTYKGSINDILVQVKQQFEVYEQDRDKISTALGACAVDSLDDESRQAYERLCHSLRAVPGVNTKKYSLALFKEMKSAVEKVAAESHRSAWLLNGKILRLFDGISGRMRS